MSEAALAAGDRAAFPAWVCSSLPRGNSHTARCYYQHFPITRALNDATDLFNCVSYPRSVTVWLTTHSLHCSHQLPLSAPEQKNFLGRKKLQNSNVITIFYNQCWTTTWLICLLAEWIAFATIRHHVSTHVYLASGGRAVSIHSGEKAPSPRSPTKSHPSLRSW